MKRFQLIAYCTTEKLSSMTKEDIRRLNAVHIAFGLIKDGEVYWERAKQGEEAAAKTISFIRSVNPDIKIILSIGGWGADGFSDAAALEEGRERFAASALRILKEEDLDGLDIDWEYPCIDAAGIRASKEDKENFTLLLKELRRQLDLLDEHKTLSIAAGALPSYLESTNMKEAAGYLDYVQLMTYDFHIGDSPLAGHHANLYESKAEPGAPDADKAVRLFAAAGVPMEKIVMGAAYYGREWIVDPNGGSGLGQKALKEAKTHRGYAELEDLAKTGKEGFRRYFDEDAKAAYLYNGKSFISYEDKEALAYKAAYMKEHQMYGMMFWEYGEDDSHTLTEYLYSKIQD